MENLQEDFEAVKDLNLSERVIERQEKFAGRVFSVELQTVELPDGSEAKREIVRHSGGATVIALNEQGMMPLVSQYRAPFGEILREIPAGKVEAGECPLACAKRELKEECGIVARKWEELAVIYPSPGYDAEVITIFLARDFSEEGAQQLDQGEFLHFEMLDFKQVFEAVLCGQIKDAKTGIAVLKAWHHLKNEEES